MQLFHDISSSLVQADWSVGMTPEKIGYVSGYIARKNLPVLKQDGDNCRGPIKSQTIFKILFTGKFSSKFTEK